ncbi:MAG: hypothetical protein V1858_04435 [Candidatus Gottesmanbacteria bacterium]
MTPAKTERKFQGQYSEDEQSQYLQLALQGIGYDQKTAEIISPKLVTFFRDNYGNLTMKYSHGDYLSLVLNTLTSTKQNVVLCLHLDKKPTVSLSMSIEKGQESGLITEFPGRIDSCTEYDDGRMLDFEVRGMRSVISKFGSSV